MQKVAVVGLILGCVTCSWGHHAFAQETIGRAVELVDPALTARVLFEAPPFTADHTGACDSRPERSECNATNISFASDLGTDAAGSIFSVSSEFTFLDAPPRMKYGNALLRTSAAGEALIVGYLVEELCETFGCQDRRRFMFGRHLSLDSTNGRIIVPVSAEFFSAGTLYARSVGIIEISGLPKLFDTLLTFAPGEEAMNILTPAHPDGFRSADTLQVWTGDVRSMPEWSRAVPLTCEAATNPVPGQVVSVADTLPAPAVGEGRYYLVASKSEADRRLGRQYLNGAFTARQPASLPICQ